MTVIGAYDMNRRTIGDFEEWNKSGEMEGLFHIQYQSLATHLTVSHHRCVTSEARLHVDRDTPQLAPFDSLAG